MTDPFFDTNILIDWLFDRSLAITELQRYPRHRISRIVWAEVLAGEPLESRDHVRDLMSAFECVEVDERVALEAAAIRYGNRIKLLDSLILATARVNGAVLITRNTRDFPADMPGVHIPYTL